MWKILAASYTQHIKSASHLVQCSISRRVCESVHVLTGIGDAFETAEELAAAVRQGVLLDSSLVPVLGMSHRTGRPIVLNRFILDYWEHGSRRALNKGNHIAEGTRHIQGSRYISTALSLGCLLSHDH